KAEAEAKLAKLLHQYNRGELIEPTKMTTGEWLQRCIDVYVKNSKKKRLRTIETYESVVRRHLIPAFDKIGKSTLFRTLFKRHRPKLAQYVGSAILKG